MLSLTSKAPMQRWALIALLAVGLLAIVLLASRQPSGDGQHLVKYKYSMPRQQVDECKALLKELTEKRDPAAILYMGQRRGIPGLPASWDELDQRRTRLVQELDEWHNLYNSTIGEGHSGQVTRQQQMYMALAQIPCVRTVCEIGFNGGHSTAVWMAARPDIKVMSFDLGYHTYAFTALRFYAQKYQGRITATFGDSTLTVPNIAHRFGRICDVLVVDGGHSAEIARADITNMAQMANQDFNIFVMDDVNCSPGYCTGPNEALGEAISSKLLQIHYGYAQGANGGEVPLPEDFQAAVANANVNALRGFSIGSYQV